MVPSQNRSLEERTARLEAELIGLRREMEQAFSAADRALTVADGLRVKRDEQQNEWRATLSDFEARTVSRTAWDQAQLAVDRRLHTLELDRAEDKGILHQREDSENRSRWMLGIAVTILSVLIGALFRFLPSGSNQ